MKAGYYNRLATRDKHNNKSHRDTAARQLKRISGSDDLSRIENLLKIANAK